MMDAMTVHNDGRPPSMRLSAYWSDGAVVIEAAAARGDGMAIFDFSIEPDLAAALGRRLIRIVEDQKLMDRDDEQ